MVMDQRERMRRAVVISDSECHEWQLKLDNRGYGRLNVHSGSRASRRSTSAHRYAWEIFVGPIPDGMNVLHKCDNRRCCNPAHLFIGTQSENMIDMYLKARHIKWQKRNKIGRFAAAGEQA